jgi:hypothetical protein
LQAFIKFNIKSRECWTGDTIKCNAGTGSEAEDQDG